MKSSSSSSGRGRKRRSCVGSSVAKIGGEEPSDLETPTPRSISGYNSYIAQPIQEGQNVSVLQEWGPQELANEPAPPDVEDNYWQWDSAYGRYHHVNEDGTVCYSTASAAPASTTWAESELNDGECDEELEDEELEASTPLSPSQGG
jgi:hypothetical protein